MSDDARAAAVEGAGSKPPQRHFAWVLNIWHLIEQDEFELAPGHILRRATADERRRIRETIARIPGGFFPLAETIWEIQWPPELPHLIPLRDENEWRYFVIAFTGSIERMAAIEAAFDVAPLELEVGFTLSEVSTLWSAQYYPARFFHVISELGPGNLNSFVDVSAADLATIKTLREKIEGHDNETLDLKTTLTQLRTLKALQHQSALRFLGYFTVLEALLTHKPKDTDTIDSITRQMKQKVALLDHRWIPRLDYAAFGSAAPKDVWGKMYDYRSKLAHGTPVDFRKDLRILVDQKRALTLLIDTVKAVVRYALDEPQLLVDLKNC